MLLKSKCWYFGSGSRKKQAACFVLRKAPLSWHRFWQRIAYKLIAGETVTKRFVGNVKPIVNIPKHVRILVFKITVVAGRVFQEQLLFIIFTITIRITISVKTAIKRFANNHAII